MKSTTKASAGARSSVAEQILSESECGSGARELRSKESRTDAAHSRLAGCGGNAIRDVLERRKSATGRLESRPQRVRAEDADGMAALEKLASER